VSVRDAGGGLPLPLPPPRTWIAGLTVGVVFLVFGSIAVAQIVSTRFRAVDGVLDLLVVLLQGLWLIGWSVGVVGLFLLTILLLSYAESARVDTGRLIHVLRLGPLRVFAEYDLAKVRNIRVVGAGKGGGRIRFDYGEGDRGLGREMPLAEAEARVKMIQTAIDSLGARQSGRATGPLPR
jgi:hypothetical protein